MPNGNQSELPIWQLDMKLHISCGQWIRMTVQLTSNHLGYFEFRLCPKLSADELVTQECLDRHLLTLADGSTRFYVTSEIGLFFPVAQLPSDVVCDHCVLQWRYTAGINAPNSISIFKCLFNLILSITRQ
jgi:hypothetical protein